ncbi:MAG: plasmid mobilization relaxosome protein MobC [Azonexus sp.]
MSAKKSVRKAKKVSAIDVQAPQRPYGEKLTKTIAFRVTEVEANRFEKRCDESGWSRADLFRATLLGTDTKINYKPVKPQTLPDFRGAAFQIRKAGNNLNQIAHSLNRAAKSKHIDERLVVAALVQLRAIKREFIAAIEVQKDVQNDVE